MCIRDRTYCYQKKGRKEVKRKTWLIMKNILIIGGTKGIGKSIVDNLVDHNNVTCLSRNKPDFQHQNFVHKEFDALSDEYPQML